MKTQSLRKLGEAAPDSKEFVIKTTPAQTTELDLPLAFSASYHSDCFLNMVIRKGFPMSSFLEYAKQYEVRENEAISAFSIALSKQRSAFEKRELNRRSWVKEDGAGYVVKLGKLESSYRIPSKDEVTEFLHTAATAAVGDEEFRALIEAAYGRADETPVKRGRKPKAAA